MIERCLAWLAHCSWKRIAREAQIVLLIRRSRLIRQVLATGTVRDLERLEFFYRLAGLGPWAEWLRYRAGYDYATFVLHRDSVAWQTRINGE